MFWTPDDDSWHGVRCARDLWSGSGPPDAIPWAPVSAGCVMLVAGGRMMIRYQPW